MEEREHAELLMDYQNRRGGKVKLLPIAAPPSEFGLDTEKGDALTALEMTLALEKLNLKRIQALHEVAEKHGDVPLADFVEGEVRGGVGSNTQRSLALWSSSCRLFVLRVWRARSSLFLTPLLVLFRPIPPPPQLLGEQVEAVQKVSEMVAQLRRAGKGLGVYMFDQNLQK